MLTFSHCYKMVPYKELKPVLWHLEAGKSKIKPLGLGSGEDVLS